MDISIRKLSAGYFITVRNDEGDVIDEACATGRWNLFPILSKYLFTKEENERASKGKSVRKKKVVKKKTPENLKKKIK